jgi:hypothetical protein
MYLERPEAMTLADAEGFAILPDIQPRSINDRSIVAVPEQWRTVGHLYRGIEAGLAQLCERYGEDAVFIGPPEGAGRHRDRQVEGADRGHRLSGPPRKFVDAD